MNQSVWFEEIDSAWLDYLKEHVKVNDSTGALVSVPVKIRKPDADFQIEEYPCVTVYNLYTAADAARFSAYPEKVVVSRGVTTLVMEGPAKLYNLSYQIDFWAKLQTDMNQMLALWLSHYWRDFELPAKDAAGNAQTCYTMEKDLARKMDFLKGSERILRTTMTYQVRGYLDYAVQETVPMVTDVETSVQNWKE